MKSTGDRSTNELQWLDLKIGHQGSSPSDGHQGDMTYCAHEGAMTGETREIASRYKRLTHSSSKQILHEIAICN